MKILHDLIRAAHPRRTVEVGTVLAFSKGRVKIYTSAGDVWARNTIQDLKGGDRVAFARVGEEAHVISRAYSRSRSTKTVRV